MHACAHTREHAHKQITLESQKLACWALKVSTFIHVVIHQS